MRNRFQFGSAEMSLHHEFPLEVVAGNNMCNFGLDGLYADGYTGHVYLATRPLPDSDETPVVAWDEDEYYGQTLAPSPERCISGYLASFGGALRAEALEQAERLVELGRAYGDTAVEGVLDSLREGQIQPEMLYELATPGSYVARAHQLHARGEAAEPAAWLEAMTTAAHYNAPLAVLMDRSPTPELALEVFRRNSKYDFGDSSGIDDLYQKAARLLVNEAPQPDSPFWPMIQRIASGVNYWRGAEGFYEAGCAFRDRGEWALAATCFENAIHLERAETERYNHKALKAIKEIANQLSTPYAGHVRRVS